MKILHTSDLHIGKKLMSRERFDEYRAVLAEILHICKSEKVELVLIAGDIFDTYTPSAEAERIFYGGVKAIAEVCSVLIISGNHDDYLRLTAASGIAGELGIYIIGNDLNPVEINRRAGAYPIESEGGYVIFENDRGERVYINTLPYPNEARFKEERSEETFTGKMTRWINFGERGKREKIPSIFLSHIFVVGGKASDSEREIDLGGARAVPTNILPDCDYIALGHLHRRQDIGDKIHYCGAPMQFTFDESGAEKSVNVFDLTENGVENLVRVPIKSAKRLVRLQANGIEQGLKLLDDYPDCYAELTLNLKEPLTRSDNVVLHQRENLASLKVELPEMLTDYKINSNKNKSAAQLFCDYYKARFDCEPPEELLSLFLSMTEEE